MICLDLKVGLIPLSLWYFLVFCLNLYFHFGCFAHYLGYQDAVAKFTLKKFLLIILFLDKAKTAHLIGYNPCLFCKDSDYKVCKSHSKIALCTILACPFVCTPPGRCLPVLRAPRDPCKPCPWPNLPTDFKI